MQLTGRCWVPVCPVPQCPCPANTSWMRDPQPRESCLPGPREGSAFTGGHAASCQQVGLRPSPVCRGDPGPWADWPRPPVTQSSHCRVPSWGAELSPLWPELPHRPPVGKPESVAVFPLLSGPYLVTVCHPEARVSLLAAPRPHPAGPSVAACPPAAQGQRDRRPRPSASTDPLPGLSPVHQPSTPEGRCGTPWRAETGTTVVIITRLCSAPGHHLAEP